MLSPEERSLGTSPVKAHEPGCVGEASPVADLRGQQQGTQLADTTVGSQAAHRVGERRRGGGLGQVGLDGGHLGVTGRRHRPDTARF